MKSVAAIASGQRVSERRIALGLSQPPQRPAPISPWWGSREC
jgi:hypothetical protein